MEQFKESNWEMENDVLVVNKNKLTRELKKNDT